MGAVSPGTSVVGVQCYFGYVSRAENRRNEFGRGFVLLGSLPLTAPLGVPLVVVPLVWAAILDGSNQ